MPANADTALEMLTCRRSVTTWHKEKRAKLPPMNTPKLALAPPPPSLTLDAPLSMAWRDGSALCVTANGILLLEAREPYSASRFLPVLSLVSPTSSSGK